MNVNLHTNFLWNEQVFVIVSNIIVGLMMFCVGITLVQFGGRIFIDWEGSYFPWLCFIISIEALFASRKMRRFSIFSTERLIYRFSELVVILLGLKIFFYVLRDIDQFYADLKLWRLDFFSTFFSGEFGIVWFVLMVIWGISGLFASMLLELEGDTEVLKPGIEIRFLKDRSEVRRGLANNIFVVGAILVILTALTRVDLEAVWGKLPPYRGGTLNVLAYFLLGLTLLSQGQFSILRASWGWQRVPIGRDLAINWAKYSLFFLTLLALIASLLPTGYSIGLLATLGYILKLLWGLLSLLVFLVFLPFLLILSLLMGRAEGEISPANIPDWSQFSPANPIPPTPFLEVMKSLIFWLLFLGVAGYAIAQFMNQNQDMMNFFSRIPGWKWFAAYWHFLSNWFRRSSKNISQAVASRLRRAKERKLTQETRELWKYISLSRLSPEEKVVFYYLALIRRGKEFQIARKPSQTPFEYAKTLGKEHTSISKDVDLLTDAFMEARYSLHKIEEDLVISVVDKWNRIRQYFRQKR